jgi:hypothetical protein
MNETHDGEPLATRPSVSCLLQLSRWQSTSFTERSTSVFEHIADILLHISRGDFSRCYYFSTHMKIIRDTLTLNWTAYVSLQLLVHTLTTLTKLTWRMPSTGMWRREAFVRRDVSEEESPPSSRWNNQRARKNVSNNWQLKHSSYC